MKVYSVVVTYNGNHWIDKCIGSLINSSYIHHDVIVIDNNSSDDSVDYIKSKYPEVKLFEANHNMGFGRANNLGIKFALENDADFVFLLNQDAWVETHTISELVKLSQKNSSCGIVAPIRKTANGLLEKDVVKNIIGKGAIDMISDIYNNSMLDIYNINFIGAAAWLLTKECIEKVGGFDDLFFHYGEDNDYCQRVDIAGLKIGICPNVLITHDTGERIPNITMVKRMKFASVLYNLRYSDKRRLLNLLHVLYLITFFKKKVLNKNRIKFKFRLKSANFKLT